MNDTGAAPQRNEDRIVAAALAAALAVVLIVLGEGTLVIAIPLILGGALLFTNAVEWAGIRLKLGEGVVGSLLAAVGTALPESIIPVIALIQGGKGAEEVAIGAIVGASFVLGTLAMAVVGISAIAFRKQRRSGLDIDAHIPTTRRDLAFFIAFFAVALGLGVGLPASARVAGAVVLVGAYLFYAWRTVRGGGELLPEGETEPLKLDRRRPEEPRGWRVAVQLAIGLGAIILGAELFVEQILDVAKSLALSPLAVALVITHVNTELPEKVNSVFWVRENKGTLALGNVTGAMAFQSTIPVSVGLVLGKWQLDRFAFVAGGLALAGGALAMIACSAGRLALPFVSGWSGFFAAFVGYVIATG